MIALAAAFVGLYASKQIERDLKLKEIKRVDGRRRWVAIQLPEARPALAVCSHMIHSVYVDKPPQHMLSEIDLTNIEKVKNILSDFAADADPEEAVALANIHKSIYFQLIGSESIKNSKSPDNIPKELLLNNLRTAVNLEALLNKLVAKLDLSQQFNDITFSKEDYQKAIQVLGLEQISELADSYNH